jgi:CO/xanthine dehydrogenase Mo-binding subunit
MTRSRRGSEDTDRRYLGRGHRLAEGHDKVTGGVRYAGDVLLPGMLHLRPVLSTEAHATIVAIDRSEAEALPGVVAVLIAEDLASRDRVITSRNSAVLARERVLFAGQPVALVAAESEQIAQDAAERVFVSYEPLPAAVDLESAAAAGSPLVWPDGPPDESEDTVQHAAVDVDEVELDDAGNVHAESVHERGDIARGFAEAEVVIERTYRTSTVHQGYLEPHAAVAEPSRGGVTVYTSTQGQFGVRNEVAKLLGLSRQRVTVVPMAVGGGFGAKYGIIDPLVAAAALKLQRPVKLVLSRGEDFQSTTPAHASVIRLRTGATRDGTLTALEAEVLVDNGAFPSTLGILSQMLGGYYRIPHLRIVGREVFTNKPHSGAYRAPGAPQATFAIESNIDEIVRELGLDPIDVRLRNAVEGGDPMVNGDPWPDLGLRECLETLRDHPLWRDRRSVPGEGLGIAIGGWPSFYGPASAVCRMDGDGSVRLLMGTVDISGSNSSLRLVAAEVLGIDPEQIELVQGDTDSGPRAPGSGGSQVTYSLARAVEGAAQAVKRQLLELAAEELEARLDDLELIDGEVRVQGVPDSAMKVSRLAALAERKKGGPGPLIGEGRAAPTRNAPGFVAHLVRVRVDAETGSVTPLHYLAIQDVGFALNPTMVEGQMHGGAVQGLGWGLHEALTFSEEGAPLAASFLEYDLPKAHRTPPIEAVIVERPSPDGPYGARGVGEPPVTAGAAAVANAVRDAVGARVTELPITPERLWRALDEMG